MAAVRPVDANQIEQLKGKTRALYLCTDALVIANANRINGLAREAGVATIWGSRELLQGAVSCLTVPTKSTFFDASAHGTRLWRTDAVIGR
jgi:hypothetical protein